MHWLKIFDRILLPLPQPSWCTSSCVHFESCPHFVQEVARPFFWSFDRTIIRFCSYQNVTKPWRQNEQVDKMMEEFDSAPSRYYEHVEHMKETICDRLFTIKRKFLSLSPSQGGKKSLLYFFLIVPAPPGKRAKSVRMPREPVLKQRGCQHLVAKQAGLLQAPLLGDLQPERLLPLPQRRQRARVWQRVWPPRRSERLSREVQVFKTRGLEFSA